MAAMTGVGDLFGGKTQKQYNRDLRKARVARERAEQTSAPPAKETLSNTVVNPAAPWPFPPFKEIKR